MEGRLLRKCETETETIKLRRSTTCVEESISIALQTSLYISLAECYSLRVFFLIDHRKEKSLTRKLYCHHTRGIYNLHDRTISRQKNMEVF